MQIITGVDIPIERDGMTAGVLHIDPTDVAFAEKSYDLIDELEAAEAVYEKRAAELDLDQSVDKHGIPTNARARLKLLRDACTDLRAKIDGVFGAGTADMAFGETCSFDVIEQFLDGIVPALESAQNKRIAKYTNRAQRRTALKK